MGVLDKAADPKPYRSDHTLVGRLDYCVRNTLGTKKYTLNRFAGSFSRTVKERSQPLRLILKPETTNACWFAIEIDNRSFLFRFTGVTIIRRLSILLVDKNTMYQIRTPFRYVYTATSLVVDYVISAFDI